MNVRSYYLMAALIVLVIANIGLTVSNSLELRAQESAGLQLDRELPEFKALLEVFKLVNNHYVDEKSADATKLWRGAIDGMLSQLDPYSTYLPAERYEEFKETTEGMFGGLGIRIEMVDGWVTVVSPLPNTPAFRQGIKARDRIYKIDGKSTRGMSINDAVSMLKGPPGTSVTINVARQLPNLEVEDLEFTIVRDVIEVPALSETTGMVTSRVGYIWLNDFTQDAAVELKNKLREFKEQGAQGVVLDLRYNSGGLLNVAIDVCNLFVPRGTVVVKVEHRDPRKNEDLTCSGAQVWDGPLAVIVNRFSASASEIVAGCIQDYRRGVIVGIKGENTFGKGSVQTVLTIDNGSALKLTTARYLTPTGRNIHEVGIRPDVWVAVPREEVIALSQERRIGYLPPGYFEDQVARAAPGSEVSAATDEITAQDVFGVPEDDKPDTPQELKNVYDTVLLEAVHQVNTMILMRAGS